MTQLVVSSKIYLREMPEMPEMGVTPLVWHDGGMFIYPSRLSAHVRAMMEAGKAAFLVIEEAARAHDPFEDLHRTALDAVLRLAQRLRGQQVRLSGVLS